MPERLREGLTWGEPACRSPSTAEADMQHRQKPRRENVCLGVEFMADTSVVSAGTWLIAQDG